ncbi:hypothetical protein [Chitinophaga sp.]|uniref:hypothetical protein n=1 Tax=Chitinophaga sp. TaxID=1869181 RepID=UPI00260C68C1|nr:hypothetical protein [uncultured Chitinophaga sp.]
MISTVLAAISTALGIFLSLKGCGQGDLEAENLRAQLSSYEPVLETAYLDITGDIYSLTRSPDSVKVNSDHFFLDYKILNNELTSGSDAGLFVFNDSDLITHTVYLMIENKGKAAANDIEIAVNKCTINMSISISEDPAAGELDYAALIESAAGRQTPASIKLPINLQPGNGYLVPILVSARPPVYNGPAPNWHVISKSVVLPKTIRFKSSISGKAVSSPVRKMRSPVRLAEGVEIRG